MPIPPLSVRLSATRVSRREPLRHRPRLRPLLTGAVACTALAASAAPAAAAAPGVLDPAFSQDGLAVLSPPVRLAGVTVSGSGKIYAAGQTVATPPRFLLARLSANGTMDAGFPKLGASGIGRAVALQPDGKVLVAGSPGGGGNGMLLERFTADGAPDGSFSGDGIADVPFAASSGDGYAVAVQGDGKIVVAGSARAADGYSRVAVARFNTNGTLDGSFGGAGQTIGQVAATGECSIPGRAVDCLRQSVGQGIAVQRDGKIVVAGYSQFNLQTRDAVVVRFNSNGSVDGSYSGDGAARLGAGTFGGGAVEFHALALQGDGKAVVTGTGAAGSNAGNIAAVTPIARLTTSGAFDGSFSGDGVASFPAARSNVSSEGARAGANGISVLAGGRIVAGGSFNDSGLNELAVWATDAGGNGAIGNGGTVVTRLPFSGIANAVGVGPDGNPVLAGEFSNLGSASGPGGLLARYGGFGTIPFPPPPPPPPVPVLAPNPKNVQVSIAHGRLTVSRRTRRTTFTVLNRNKGGAAIRINVTLASKGKVRVSKRRRVVVTFARTKLNVPARARRKVTLRLSRGNLALLLRLHRVSARVTVTVSVGRKRATIRKNVRLEASRK